MVWQTPPPNLPRGFWNLGVLVPLRDASLEFTSDPETPGALVTPSPTMPFRKEDSFRRLRQPGGVPRASDNVCLTQNTDWNEAVRTAGLGSWGCLDASVCYVPVRASPAWHPSSHLALFLRGHHWESR